MERKPLMMSRKRKLPSPPTEQFVDELSLEADDDEEYDEEPSSTPDDPFNGLMLYQVEDHDPSDLLQNLEFQPVTTETLFRPDELDSNLPEFTSAIELHTLPGSTISVVEIKPVVFVTEPKLLVFEQFYEEPNLFSNGYSESSPSPKPSSQLQRCVNARLNAVRDSEIDVVALSPASSSFVAAAALALGTAANSSRATSALSDKSSSSCLGEDSPPSARAMLFPDNGSNSQNTSPLTEQQHQVITIDTDMDEHGIGPGADDKKYYCQRCLNHGVFRPRKGHKPECRYAQCSCEDCIMVEQRRQLNNLLSKEKAQTPRSPLTKGKRVRDPHCARCGAHGVKMPLRGHKRVLCQFANCTCQLCELVENRRSLMAKQIKLRRDQQRQRSTDERQSADSVEEICKSEPPSSVEVSPSPPGEIVHPSPRLPIMSYPNAMLPLQAPSMFGNLGNVVSTSSTTTVPSFNPLTSVPSSLLQLPMLPTMPSFPMPTPVSSMSAMAPTVSSINSLLPFSRPNVNTVSSLSPVTVSAPPLPPFANLMPPLGMPMLPSQENLKLLQQMHLAAYLAASAALQQ